MTGAEPLLFALRAHLYAHPFVAIVIISLALALARKAAATTVEASFSRPAALTSFVSWFPIALYTFAGAAYLFSPAYSDHIEPSIAAVSWYHVSGAPLYPSADAAAQYALPYGPLLYLVNGITLQLAGPSVFASKLAGLLAALLSLILLARALARRTRRVVPVVAAVALGYLAFGTMTFWARSEPLLLLLVAVSLTQFSAGGYRQAAALGVAAGLACNIKVTAVLYFVPLAAHLARQHGTRAITLAGALAVGVFAAPFALETVSLRDYVAWLTATMEHGIRGRGLGGQVEWAVVLLIAGLGSNVRDWSSSPLRWGFLVAVIATVPVAAKLGAGAYHFIPFLPLAAYVHSTRDPSSRTPAPLSSLPAHTILIVAVVLGALQQFYWIQTLRRTDVAAMHVEISEIARSTTRPLAMGYTANYRTSFLRPVLVFGGHPYTLDAPALMDHQMSGIAFPSAAVEALRSCETAWILPKGEPFVLPNAYRPDLAVFPESFRATFFEHYRRTSTGTSFDLWECSATGGSHRATPNNTVSGSRRR